MKLSSTTLAVFAACLITVAPSTLSAIEIAGRDLDGWKKDLTNDNRTIRLRAAKTIGVFGAEAIETLTEMLSHDDAAIQYWAASHLGNIGAKAKIARRALIPLANDSSSSVRFAASFALCSIDGTTKWSKPLLEGVNTSD